MHYFNILGTIFCVNPNIHQISRVINLFIQNWFAMQWVIVVRRPIRNSSANIMAVFNVGVTKLFTSHCYENVMLRVVHSSSNAVLLPIYTHTTTILRPFFQDHPGEPVPEENFWTLWCKRRLTEADTPTIRLGTTPYGLTSAHLHHLPHIFYRPDALPAAQPTASKH